MVKLILASAGLVLPSVALALALACPCTDEADDQVVGFAEYKAPPAGSGTKESESAAVNLDIIATADSNKDFSTLVTAIKAAGLVETLKGKGPFTVFAPTHAAFEKLPKETLANLLKPENKAQLAGILGFHVVSGEVKAAEAVKLDGKSVKTVNGAEFKVAVKDGKVTIGTGEKNVATVTKTDIIASNGVIHVIDTVILPPAPATPAPAPKAPEKK
ncbi:MAG: fasciclin domain-containing protein [bacterium]